MSGDPARTRFFVIQACRWAGMALAVLGILALNGSVLPRGAAYVLVPLGLAAALVAPSILSRRWRSDRQ